MQSAKVKEIARECGFELAGVASLDLTADFQRYRHWVDRGMAGEMRYLTDHRAELRRDVRTLLPSARSVVCVGKLYNTHPEIHDPPISRYAWGQDYHDVVRRGLETFAERLHAQENCETRICVDTAPILERTLARMAGLGWIGKNTCLINEPQGSWFFLGEILTSLELEPDSPPPGRCGTCTRCIEACPTQAIVPDGDGWTLDARRCISYLNIELRGPIPEEFHASMGSHVFGCDICQEVCPWNSRAPITEDPAFLPKPLPPLETLAELSKEQFRDLFRQTPVMRAKHEAFLRNSAIALANLECAHD